MGSDRPRGIEAKQVRKAIAMCRFICEGFSTTIEIGEWKPSELQHFKHRCSRRSNVDIQRTKVPLGDTDSASETSRGEPPMKSQPSKQAAGVGCGIAEYERRSDGQHGFQGFRHLPDWITAP